MDDDQLSQHTVQLDHDRSMLGATAAAFDPSEARNLVNDLAATEAAAGSRNTLQPLEAAAVRNRASQLFAGGEGKLSFASGPKLANEPTLQLLKLAKEAVNELLTLQRSEVNEGTSQRLTKEDALGYLLGDALGVELLPPEARKVGHKATGLLKVAKARDDKLMSGASAKRSKARQAAEKDESKVAGLDAKLAEIDSKRDAERRELWDGVPDLGMPDRKAKIGESKAKVDTVASLRTEEQRALDLIPIRHAEAAIAKQAFYRESERYGKISDRLTAANIEGYQRDNDAECAAIRAELAQCKARLDGELMERLKAAFIAVDQAQHDAQLARQLVLIAEHRRQQDAEVAQLTKALAEAEAAAWAATEARESAQEEQAELQAELHENNALVEDIEQKLALERTATRERLECDAYHVWGPSWQHRPAAAVYDLRSAECE